jgi:Rieske Fe-S protein
LAADETGAAAAGVAAGFGIEKVLGSPSDASPAQDQLRPIEGTWVAVADTSTLAPGTMQRFSAHGIEGVVVNDGGSIRALSAICTDMGCTLAVDQPQQRLVCPCHGASFSITGAPETSRVYGKALAPLPVVAVRTNGDTIEVLVPTRA